VRGYENGKAPLQAVNETEHALLGEIEFMVDFFAEGAKAYWRLWGPLGDPMVHAVEEWEKMQRAYFRSVHHVIWVPIASKS
jgi:hypothetical protein